MARCAAVVDRSHRGVIAVPGDDRLSWLHLLLTQHVSELPDGAGTEALVLDLNGRVLHHMVVSHVDATRVARHRAGRRAGAAGLPREDAVLVEGRAARRPRELAVLSVVGPDTPAVLAGRGRTRCPRGAYSSAPLPGGGLVRRMPWPGPDAADLSSRAPRRTPGSPGSPRRARGRPGRWRSRRCGWRRCGRGCTSTRTTGRSRTRSAGSRRPCTWTKGCYRGQETVARVANLGRPPRRLVLLHLDAGDEELPAPGDPVLRDGRAVGRVGTVALHHELGRSRSRW